MDAMLILFLIFYTGQAPLRGLLFVRYCLLVVMYNQTHTLMILSHYRLG